MLHSANLLNQEETSFKFCSLSNIIAFHFLLNKSLMTMRYKALYWEYSCEQTISAPTQSSGRLGC